MEKNNVSVYCVFAEKGEPFTELIKQSFRAFLLGALGNDHPFTNIRK